MTDGFQISPANFVTWRNNIVSVLSGKDVGSFNDCATALKLCLENLVNEKAWTGDEAKRNYEQFKNSFLSLTTFINEFQKNFDESFGRVEAAVTELETADGGSFTRFGEVAKVDVATLDGTVETEISNVAITYNLTVLETISTSLNTIKTDLSAAKNKLVSEIQKLNSSELNTDETVVWSGPKAEEAKTALLEDVNKYLGESTEGAASGEVKNLENTVAILQNIEVCVSNIAIAKSNAANSIL